MGEKVLVRKCNFCGRQITEGQIRCPACGLAYSVPSPLRDITLNKPGSSDLTRYTEFLGDEDLFRAAVCFKNGIAMREDETKAKELFYALAMRGNYDGMFQYAELCLSSRPADVVKALHWLNIAAKSGHISSRLKLCELAEDGLTSQNDYSEIFTDCNAAQSGKGGVLEARVRNALPYIVTISSERRKLRSLGSGFVLDGGIIVTNAHVVGEQSAYVTARFEPSIDSVPYELKCLGVFKDYDVAILKFKGFAAEKFAGRKSLCLRLNTAEYGEEVYTIGNPLGLGLSVSKGIISCPNRDSDYCSVKEVIQTDITANHGNSGGALLDSENRVLGVITYVPGASDGGIAMCVPSKYIVQVLNKVEI